MTRTSGTVHCDIAEILGRKANGRVTLAALSFGEKIARMEALRERLHPIRMLRRSVGEAEAGTPHPADQ